MDFVLSRGCFYPKDHRQAELLVELHGEIEVGYCRLEQAGASDRDSSQDK